MYNVVYQGELMPPAARVADPTTHETPLAPGPGSINVLIGGMPAWRAVLDQHACPVANITGPDGVGSVMMGSPTVFINGMMACRMGDIVIEKPGLALGPVNPIIIGCPTVIIGQVGMGAVGTADASGGIAALSAAMPGSAGSAAKSLAAAAQSGAGTIPLARSSTLTNAIASAGNGESSSSAASTGSSSSTSAQKTWIEIELQGPDGKPVLNESYRIGTPGGTVHEGSTDSRGVARLDGIDPGNCKISFPFLDKEAWSRR